MLQLRRAELGVKAAVYPPLILLTRIIRLADEPFLALLSAIISPYGKADPCQRLLTLLVVLDDRSGWEQGLGDEGSSCLAKVKMLGQNLAAAMERFGFEEGMKTVLKVMIERSARRVTGPLR